MPPALELQPVTGAPGRVTAVRALADDSLQVILPRRMMEGLAPFGNVLAVLDHTPAREEASETFLALQQGEGTEVPPLGFDAVEEEPTDRHRARGPLDIEAVRQVHAPLEPLEARPAGPVHGDDLAVDEEPFRRGLAQRVDDLRIPPGDVVTLASEEGDGVALTPGEDADAVVLDLEDPGGMGEGVAAG